MKLSSSGHAGHGSQFLEPSATVKLLKVLNKFIEFRETEKQRLSFSINELGRPLMLGDVTSTNITMLNAGVQYNIVHELAEAGILLFMQGIDMRVAPTVDHEKLQKTIQGWCDAEDVKLTFVQQFLGNGIVIYSLFIIGMTPLSDTNREWQILQKVASARCFYIKFRNITLCPEIFPAATDSRFLRQIGLPAFGISAIKKTPVLLHDHNEYLNENTLIDGIGFYVDLISGIAN
jgi:aminoacylase